MAIIPVEDIAAKWGVTVRCIQNYCRDGRIPGAVKTSGVWMIPEEATKRAGIAFGNSYFDTYRYAETMKAEMGWENVKLEYLS